MTSFLTSTLSLSSKGNHVAPTPQSLSLIQRLKWHQTGMKSPSAVLTRSAGRVQLRGAAMPHQLFRYHFFSSSSSCLQEQPTERCCWLLGKCHCDKLCMRGVPAATASDALWVQLEYVRRTRYSTSCKLPFHKLLLIRNSLMFSGA